MTEEFTDKSIKNVPFSGKQADYEKWAKRFLSYAQMKKVKQILLGKEKPPSTTEILEISFSCIDKNSNLDAIELVRELTTVLSQATT